ncbi:DUF6132 family protein [Mangrovibacterium sp.]|uniref:DUF6132 family protein n=1 Tax=Mangrovibacterium sp. TaxID=1961364 RepID=UPI00356682D7
MKFKQLLTRYKWQAIGVSIGLIGGYLYWYYIGCTSGTCPIQANWHTSTLYGGLLGYFVGDLKKRPKTNNDKTDGTV